MTIKFSCPSCHRQLYVANTYAGLEARCPGCGEVTSVPGERSQPPQQTFAAPWPSSVGAAEANPFAPTGQLSYVGQLHTAEAESLERSGPPWERDGISIRSFFATFWQCLTGPNVFFCTMRLEGGTSAPLNFSMLAAVCCAGFTAVWQIGVMLYLTPWRGVGFLEAIFILGGVLLLLPLFLVLMLVVQAVILHLMLVMVGGARQSFEVTLRAIAYASGTAFLLATIPFFGPNAMVLAQPVLVVISLARTHEIGIGRALLAMVSLVGTIFLGWLFVAVSTGRTFG